jgi:hypothetical protein
MDLEQEETTMGLGSKVADQLLRGLAGAATVMPATVSECNRETDVRKRHRSIVSCVNN